MPRNTKRIADEIRKSLEAGELTLRSGIMRLAILPPIVKNKKIDAAFADRMRTFWEAEMIRVGAFDVAPREAIDKALDGQKPKKSYDYQSLLSSLRTFGGLVFLEAEISPAPQGQLYFKCSLKYNNGSKVGAGINARSSKAVLNSAFVTAPNDMAAFGAALGSLLDKLGIEPIPYADYVIHHNAYNVFNKAREEDVARPYKNLGPAEVVIGADGIPKSARTIVTREPLDPEILLRNGAKISPLKVNGAPVESKVIVL
jgi:hypothetical protein